jgi:nucleotide-binding universal stress UspA family protein
MPDVLFPILVLVTWVAVGLAAVVYLGRHGRRSPAWFVVGVALGPILLPIALEIAQREGTVLSRSVVGNGGTPARLTVLAAVDGSEESDDALADASRILAPEGVRFILLTVMDPDLGENDPQARHEAEELLESRAARIPRECLPPVLEVVAGEPGHVILDRVRTGAVDLVVLGRRGRGLSQMLIGSVADQVVRRSPRPVLLGSTRSR